MNKFTNKEFNMKNTTFFTLGVLVLTIALFTACKEPEAEDNDLKGTVSITAETMRVGKTATADVGGLNGTTGKYTYQWTRDSVNIPSATGESYAITEDDFGAILGVVVRNGDKTGSAYGVAESTVRIQQEFIIMVGDSFIQIVDTRDDTGFTLADSLIRLGNGNGKGGAIAKVIVAFKRDISGYVELNTVLSRGLLMNVTVRTTGVRFIAEDGNTLNVRFSVITDDALSAGSFWSILKSSKVIESMAANDDFTPRGIPAGYTNENGVWYYKEKTILLRAPLTITSITIPASVTTIDEYAFDSCTSLTSITIPASVKTMGQNAFQSCTGLASITIPPSVTTMGQNAFAMWTSTQTINVPFANDDARPAGWDANWKTLNCNAVIKYLQSDGTYQ